MKNGILVTLLAGLLYSTNTCSIQKDVLQAPVIDRKPSLESIASSVFKEYFEQTDSNIKFMKTISYSNQNDTNGLYGQYITSTTMCGNTVIVRTDVEDKKDVIFHELLHAFYSQKSSIEKYKFMQKSMIYFFTDLKIQKNEEKFIETISDIFANYVENVYGPRDKNKEKNLKSYFKMFNYWETFAYTGEYAFYYNLDSAFNVSKHFTEFYKGILKNKIMNPPYTVIFHGKE